MRYLQPLRDEAAPVTLRATIRCGSADAMDRPVRSSGVGAVRRCGAAMAHVLAWALACIAIWHDRAEGRRHLARMDDRLLRDVGISRADAWQEARKPWWQP